MKVNRQQTDPLGWSKSTRSFQAEVGTSLPAGKVVPVFATALLRQDAFKAHLNFNIEMLETKELLANPVKARVSAYVVPWLAMERFEKSRDQFDRSYMGQPQVDGGSVVPFFDFHKMGAAGADDVYQYLGLHAPENADVETSYVEAYNLIQNFRAINRSRDIALRTRTDTSLAQAFWDLGRFRHVLPDFDQAVMEGEVALSLAGQSPALDSAPVVADGALKIAQGQVSGEIVYASGDGLTWSGGVIQANQPMSVDDPSGLKADMSAWADELAESGLKISLANIEMAKGLQSFAKLREKFTGHVDDDSSDEYIVDMLMSGLRIPDRSLTQPILIKQETLTFSQGKRYATDSGNLDDSAVSGFAGTGMTLRVPEIDTGGIVMVVVECFPQQLFERQADPLWNIKALVDDRPAGQPETFVLPEAVRDFLDPEKVDVVSNAEVDQSHTSPTATFGFAPLNWRWGVGGPRLGGKFHSEVATSADRQRFWAAETVDPVLGEDFYLVPSDLQTDVFLRAADPFELFCSGPVQIHGLTQFGGQLIEQTGNYEKLEAQMDDERIDQEA